MHGGKAGAPKGNKNALKDGAYTAESRARLAAIRYLLHWEKNDNSNTE